MSKKLTIEFVKNEIETMHPGCKVLSKEYIGSGVKLNILCENGHFCKATWNKIQQGYWCGECNKITIEKIKNFIEKNHLDAELKSTEYIDAHSKIKIICENGHIYNTGTWSNIKQGQWCGCCKKITTEKIRNFIEKNHSGAELKSTEYINSKTTLKIICENGHIYNTGTWNNIQQGYWCKECDNNNIGEEFCRKVFEEKYKKSFPKNRPDWLKNPKTKRFLELDGFNEELKIAFEYDGSQHFEFPNCFHKDEQAFKDQQERDKLKDVLCKQNSIKLIRIKYVNYKKQEKAKKLILEQIENNLI